MTAAYRASLRKLMMEAWSLREIPVDGKSSILTLSPVSDSIRERKTERKRTLCWTKTKSKAAGIDDQMRSSVNRSMGIYSH